MPTTPRSIELDLEGRQECKLVDSCKFKVLEECRHPTVIHVVLEETQMDVENESSSGLGLSWIDLLVLGVCHLFVVEDVELGQVWFLSFEGKTWIP